MPLGGETIGAAYVKIIADGRDLPRQVREEFDNTKGDFHDAGEEGGKEYADAFDKSYRKSYRGHFNKTQKEILEDLNKSWTDALARQKLADNFFKSPGWKKLRKRMSKEGGAAGELFAEEMERKFKDSGALDRLEAGVSTATQEMARNRKAILNKMHEEALQMEKDFQKKSTDLQRRGVMQEQAIRMNQERDLKRLKEDYNHLIQSMKAALDPQMKTTVSSREMTKEYHRLRGEMDRVHLITPQMNRDFDDMNKRLLRMHPTIDKTNHHIGRFSDLVGVTFGRGSRNNFLNFIGSMARNFTRLPMLFTNSAAALLSWGRGIGAASGVGGKLAAAFGPMAKGGLAVAAALSAMLLIIGPLVALLSSLLGVITALVSTIGFGLVGALAALAGALLPVVAGAGTAVLAFMNMDKTAKAALRSVGNEFKGLGKVAAQGVFSNITAQAQKFKSVMSGFEPVTRRIGFAISRIGDYWLQMMQGPGFKAFRQAMEAFLPNAVETLGRIFGNVFGGLGGILRGMIPLLNRFLHWFEGVTKKFSDWANSARGQNSIRKFFEDAGDSAAQLGHFLAAVARLLGTVLSAGRGVGDSLFGSMTNKLNEWTAALRKDPDILRRWFNNAKEFGQELGNVLVAVGRLFDALDSPATRLAAKGMFGPMIIGLNVLSRALSITQEAWGRFLVAAGKGMQIIGHAPGFGWVGDLGDKAVKAGRGMIETAQGAKAAANGTNLFKASSSGLAGTLDQVTGAATHATRAYQLMKLRQSGVVEMSNRIGISTRDLISASLGQAAAQRRVNAALLRHPELLGKIGPLLRSMGINYKNVSEKTRLAAREANQWANAVNRLPRRLMMKVSAVGMPKTVAQFKQLVHDIKLTPKQVRTLVKASGVPITKKQLESLIKTAKDFGRQKPKAHPDVDPKRASGHFKDLMKQSGTFNRQRPKPTADVNKRPATLNLDSIIRKVRETDRQRANPSVSVRDNASGTLSRIRQSLSAINGSSAWSTVYTLYKKVKGAGGGMFGEEFKLASGGLVQSEHFSRGGNVMIGEAGMEAVVPMSRPLGLVDPSVRRLSAFAQGKGEFSQTNSRTVEVGGITIVTPTKDPHAVAIQTMNELVGRSY